MSWCHAICWFGDQRMDYDSDGRLRFYGDADAPIKRGDLEQHLRVARRIELSQDEDFLRSLARKVKKSPVWLIDICSLRWLAGDLAYRPRLFDARWVGQKALPNFEGEEGVIVVGHPPWSFTEDKKKTLNWVLRTTRGAVASAITEKCDGVVIPKSVSSVYRGNLRSEAALRKVYYIEI